MEFLKRWWENSLAARDVVSVLARGRTAPQGLVSLISSAFTIQLEPLLLTPLARHQSAQDFLYSKWTLSCAITLCRSEEIEWLKRSLKSEVMRLCCHASRRAHAVALRCLSSVTDTAYRAVRPDGYCGRVLDDCAPFHQFVLAKLKPDKGSAHDS